ncbi:MAG: hypothetical protein RTU92_13745 [Candidatus Thorarchaeota archaeon]
MVEFKQEWISPILEVYQKGKIEDTYTIILGLNPLGQTLCRQLYEQAHFESVLVFNSPSFSSWNRYPLQSKPPIIPVHGMVNDDLMLVFGDVVIREFEWATDLLFFLRGNVPHRFIVAAMVQEGPTCGQVLTKKGERLLNRMKIPMGRPDFYDGLIAPLISIGSAAGLDSVALFLEATENGSVIYQMDEVPVTQEDVTGLKDMLEKGLDFRF